jgi:hypothetical protein
MSVFLSSSLAKLYTLCAFLCILHVSGTIAPRYVEPQALDQLEEWIKEKPIPYISHDKFRQEDIFH